MVKTRYTVTLSVILLDTGVDTSHVENDSRGRPRQSQSRYLLAEGIFSIGRSPSGVSLLTNPNFPDLYNRVTFCRDGPEKSRSRGVP